MNQFDVSPFPDQKHSKHLFLKKSEKSTLSHAKLPPLPVKGKTQTLEKKLTKEESKMTRSSTTAALSRTTQQSDDDHNDSIVNLAYDQALPARQLNQKGTTEDDKIRPSLANLLKPPEPD